MARRQARPGVGNAGAAEHQAAGRRLGAAHGRSPAPTPPAPPPVQRPPPRRPPPRWPPPRRPPPPLAAAARATPGRPVPAPESVPARAVAADHAAHPATAKGAIVQLAALPSEDAARSEWAASGTQDARTCWANGSPRCPSSSGMARYTGACAPAASATSRRRRRSASRCVPRAAAARSPRSRRCVPIGLRRDAGNHRHCRPGAAA